MRSACLLAAALTVATIAAFAASASANSTTAWTSPATLVPSVVTQFELVYAESATGLGLVATAEYPNGTAVLAVYTRAPGGSFGGPVYLSNESTDLQGYLVAADDSGRAVVAYDLFDFTSISTWVQTYTAAGGWSVPQQLPSIYGNATLSSLAAGAGGDIFVGSDDYNATVPNQLFVEHYSPSGGWDPSPHPLGSVRGTDLPYIATVAASAGGQGLVTWGFLSGSVINGSLAQVYNSSAGWGPTVTLSLVPRSGFGFGAFVGEMALFSQSISNGTHSDGYMRTYSPAAGWSGPILIESFAANVSTCFVTGNRAGNLTAVFGVRPTLTNRDFYASHYTPATGWEAPVTLDATPLNASGGVLADGKGGFVVTWILGAGKSNEVWSKRYLAGRGWQPEIQVSPSNTFLNFTYLGVAASGNATVVWMESGSPYSIRYADMVVDDEPPSLSVVQPGAYLNAALVEFAGFAEPDALVWVDGSPAAVDAAGAFSVNLTEVEGNRTAFVLAADREGNVAQNTVSFVVDLAAHLAVDYPSDGLLVSVNLVAIHGTCEPGSTMTINGFTVNTEPGGVFDSQLTLTRGANTFLVECVDRALNHAQVALHVQYFDAIAPLQAEIANLTAAIEALQNSSSGSSADLDAALQALGAATANLAAANASIAAANANKTEADARYHDAQTNLTIAQTRLADAQRERDEANARALAAPASSSGTLDVLLGVAAIAGVCVGLMGMMMARRKGEQKESTVSKGETVPPKP